MAPLTQQEMKRPVNWWNVISVFLAIAIPVSVALIGYGRTLAEQEVRLKKLETDTYINQVKTEGAFEKTNNKMEQGFEKVNGKLEQVLINMERKADRSNH